MVPRWRKRSLQSLVSRIPYLHTGHFDVFIECQVHLAWDMQAISSLKPGGDLISSLKPVHKAEMTFAP